jgi:predicted membrane chloride channel (bestrophin family)
MPNVRNTIRDEARNLTFHILAYRTLRPAEMILMVRQWAAQQRRRKMLKNQQITILTTFGASPNL